MFITNYNNRDNLFKNNIKFFISYLKYNKYIDGFYLLISIRKITIKHLSYNIIPTWIIEI